MNDKSLSQVERVGLLTSAIELIEQTSGLINLAGADNPKTSAVPPEVAVELDSMVGRFSLLCTHLLGGITLESDTLNVNAEREYMQDAWRFLGDVEAYLRGVA